MTPSNENGPGFAVFSYILDHRKLQRFLNEVIEGEITYESPNEMACYLWNRCVAGEFYPDKGEQ